MSMVLNRIRDALLTSQEQQERKDAIAGLELTKLALRVGSAAICLNALFNPSTTSVALLSIAYLNVEWSFVASNGQELLEDATIELMALLSETALKNQLLKNAPITQSVYHIFEAYKS